MFTVHYRMHEIGRNARVRMWTKEMEACGQFDVIDNDLAQQFKQVGDKLGIKFIRHHCDGLDECDCKPLEHGQPIE